MGSLLDILDLPSSLIKRLLSEQRTTHNVHNLINLPNMHSSSFNTADLLIFDAEASATCLPFSEGDLEPLPFHQETGWPANDRIIFDFEPTPIESCNNFPPVNSSLSAMMNMAKEDPSSALLGTMYNPLSMALLFNNLVKNNQAREETPGPSNIDVVCSRGRRFYELPGCVRFRKIVLDFIPSYITANSRVDKSSVIALIIDEVMNHEDGDVRFLKYQTSTKSWIVMGKEQIRDKVGHALREVIEDMNRNERLAASR